MSGNDPSRVSGDPTDGEGGGEKQGAAKRRRRRALRFGSLPVASALLRAGMDRRAGKRELQWP